jgi:hypothetical protein
MLDRVFHQGLQQQPRQQHAAEVGRNVPIEAQRITVARLEDLRVTPEPRDLLVERLHLTLPLQRITQQVSETSKQAPSLTGILRHQPSDGVESVEEEMRLELRAQSRHLRRNPELLGLEA